MHDYEEIEVQVKKLYELLIQAENIEEINKSMSSLLTLITLFYHSMHPKIQENLEMKIIKLFKTQGMKFEDDEDFISVIEELYKVPKN